VTIIVFGARDKAIVGKHWISYSGSLDPHQKDREFPDNSIGYKVLYGRETSPFFSTSERLNKPAKNVATHPTGPSSPSA